MSHTDNKADWLDEILDSYYAPIKLPDNNREGLKQAIETHCAQKIHEAERRARERSLSWCRGTLEHNSYNDTINLIDIQLAALSSHGKDKTT